MRSRASSPEDSRLFSIASAIARAVALRGIALTLRSKQTR